MRILPGAILNGELGAITVGADVVIMEHAVLRGRAEHPLRIGDAVLVGPHTHLNGTRIEDEVLVATGVSAFAGTIAGAGSELRINSVLHVNSVLPPGAVVPIGWIAAGDPAELFSPDRHEDLWVVQQRLARRPCTRPPRYLDARDHAPAEPGVRAARRAARRLAGSVCRVVPGLPGTTQHLVGAQTLSSFETRGSTSSTGAESPHSMASQPS